MVSENPPVTLVAKANGNMSHIFVADSQRVGNGELLAVIKNPANLNHILYLKELLNNHNATNDTFSVKWLETLSDTLQLGDIQNNYSSLLKTSHHYLQFTKLRFLPKKIASLNNKMIELERYGLLMKKQSGLKVQDYALAKNQFKRDSILYRKDVISLSDYEKSKKELLQNSLSLENARSVEVNTRIQIQDLEQQIVDLQMEQAKQKQDFQNLLTEQLNNLESRLAWWYDTYLLVSPINGIVAFNTVWSKNQYIKSGNEVFTVLPEKQSAILGRAALPVKGSGKVKIGHRANIKFDNYPYREFGMITASVSSISLVSNQQKYVVEIILPDTLITNYGYILPFSQKMLGEAEIITEDLPLIVRLFNPLKAILKNHIGTPVFKVDRKTGTFTQKAPAKNIRNKNQPKVNSCPTEKTALNKLVIEKNTKKLYHVIAGSFIENDKAQKELMRLQSRGYKCKLLKNNGRLRLSVFSTPQKTVAFKKLEQVKAAENNNAIWVLVE